MIINENDVKLQFSKSFFGISSSNKELESILSRYSAYSSIASKLKIRNKGVRRARTCKLYTYKYEAPIIKV